MSVHVVLLNGISKKIITRTLLFLRIFIFAHPTSYLSVFAKKRVQQHPLLRKTRDRLLIKWETAVPAFVCNITKRTLSALFLLLARCGFDNFSLTTPSTTLPCNTALLRAYDRPTPPSSLLRCNRTFPHVVRSEYIIQSGLAYKERSTRRQQQ